MYQEGSSYDLGEVPVPPVSEAQVLILSHSIL